MLWYGSSRESVTSLCTCACVPQVHTKTCCLPSHNHLSARSHCCACVPPYAPGRQIPMRSSPQPLPQQAGALAPRAHQNLENTRNSGTPETQAQQTRAQQTRAHQTRTHYNLGRTRTSGTPEPQAHQSLRHTKSPGTADEDAPDKDPWSTYAAKVWQSKAARALCA